VTHLKNKKTAVKKASPTPVLMSLYHGGIERLKFTKTATASRLVALTGGIETSAAISPA
jgi:hypothetical protein